MMENFTKEEEYIIDESAELTLGENQGWIDRFFLVFPAFKSRNYKLYFIGQIISMIGSWLQMVAQSWLILELTDSAFYVGLVAAASTVPSLLFSLFGGVIVDHFSKRKILIITESAAMVLAFVLGALTIFGFINIWGIILLSFLTGCVAAIDIPARQAFTVEIVEKENLASAIALNSAIFNSSRIIGPSIAGFAIALIGTGGTFIANGISYIAAIVSLFLIKTIFIPNNNKLHPIKAIKEGVRYSIKHPLIKTILIFSAVISIFGWSYTTIIPVIAKNTFHVEAAGLGYLFAASGLGALLATILIQPLSKRIGNFSLIFLGILIFSTSIISFTFVSSFILALALMFLSGTGMLLAFSTINSALQRNIEDRFRGRVMSIYSLVFMGLAPVGNLEIGYISERFGTAFGIQLGATVVLLSAIIFFLKRKKIKTSFETYKLNQKI